MCTAALVTLSEISSKIVNKANNRATNKGRYDYKSVLGEGSFGHVLKATDKSTNEDVAVKIIKAKKSIIEQILFFKTSAYIKQGKKEISILTDLQHPNITAIQDNFTFRKSAFKSGLAIVMEYCPGGNLQTHLEGLAVRGERTTEEGRLSWFKQLASALAFIHHKDFAHRDLKPANILIGRDGQLKVADVGIAKTLYDHLEAWQGSYQKYMETAVGTYPYMAPEVFNEHYTISSDVFSMGLVMFVTCELPYNPRRTGAKLLPIVQCKGYEDFLGYFLHRFHGQLDQNSTSLMNAMNCPSDELELFDSMLQYDHHRRPTASKVLEELKRIEKERREKREEDERRRRELEELEARRRCEAEIRRREEESWCCIL
jgi:serine/threonine protein kinase